MNPTAITAQPGSPYIDVARDFDAPPELVFRAHTDQHLVARWLVPRGMQMEVLEHDARTGGSYRYVHRSSAREFRFRGVFHAVVPEQLIVQTFEYEGMPGQVSLQTVRFEGIDGRTRLTMHHVFGSVEARDEMVEAGMENGVRDSMDRLAEVLRPGQARVLPDLRTASQAETRSTSCETSFCTCRYRRTGSSAATVSTQGRRSPKALS